MSGQLQLNRSLHRQRHQLGIQVKELEALPELSNHSRSRSQHNENPHPNDPNVNVNVDASEYLPSNDNGDNDKEEDEHDIGDEDGLSLASAACECECECVSMTSSVSSKYHDYNEHNNDDNDNDHDNDNDLDVDHDDSSTSEQEEQLNHAVERLHNRNRHVKHNHMHMQKLTRRNSLSMVNDRASIIDSIQWLSRHVPHCVLRQLTHDTLCSMNTTGENDENENENERGMNRNMNMGMEMEMPHGTQYEAALLFIDMSGFTNLAQKLDVDRFSKAINSYFRTIVDEVISRGGDILKFAGDAMFVEWRVGETFNEYELEELECHQDNNGPSRLSLSRFLRRSRGRGRMRNGRGNVKGKGKTKGESQSNGKEKDKDKGESRGRMTLEDCVYAAAVCGAMVVQKCSDYPIYSHDQNEGRRASHSHASMMGKDSNNYNFGNGHGHGSSNSNGNGGTSNQFNNGGEKVATLNVHCGIGVGEMGGVHVCGNDQSRRRMYLVLGSPIDQVSEACDKAKLGEIRASKEALAYLTKKMESEEYMVMKKKKKKKEKDESTSSDSELKLVCDEGERSKVIASKQQIFFNTSTCCHDQTKWNSLWKRKPIFPWKKKKNHDKNMKMNNKIQTQPKKPNSRFIIPMDDMDTATLKVLRKALSFYVHPVVVADETAEYEDEEDEEQEQDSDDMDMNMDVDNSRNVNMPPPATASTQNECHDPPPQQQHPHSHHRQAHRRRSSSRRLSMSLRTSRRGSVSDGTLAIKRHQSEAELRPVFTIFIQPHIEATLAKSMSGGSNGNEDGSGGNAASAKNSETFKLLNDIMYIVTSILDRYKGHLLQFIVDDKGVVLIGTFGLRGSTFPHMVQERALPTCRFIQSALANELGIESQIGATLGKVYCGVVGGVERHEFSVLGASVNLSARLMSQKKNHPGIIMVDEEVYKRAKKVMNFIKFPPVLAKGYDQPVSVYKPLTAKETRWGKINPMFVGRKAKEETLCKVALEMARRERPSKIVFVTGQSGIGKSSFLVHAIAKIRQALRVRRANLMISRNTSSEGDTLLPFSIFQRIFRDLLDEKRHSDEDTLGSKSTSILSMRGREHENFTYSDDVTDEKRASILEQLKTIAREIDAPESLTQIIGHHLIGSSKFKMSKVEKAPDLVDYIAFMTNMFLAATSHAEVVLLALDDVQCLDSLSWKVIQNIFEKSTNILIVCATPSMEASSLTMEEQFSESLMNHHLEEGRFLEVQLDALTKHEVRDLAALNFACKTNELDEELVDDIFRHSVGMPHFASEILDNCVKNKRFDRLPSKKIGWSEEPKQSKDDMQFANLNELMLQRIDNLGELARKVLQFASVLGPTFDFDEILEISGHILFIPEEEMANHSMEVQLALEAAVEEGILDETVRDEVMKGEQDDFLTSLTIKVGEGSYEETELTDTAEYRVYSFHHSSWQQLVLSLLLDSWKRDIHKHAAMAIEASSPDTENRDHRTKVKLFQHWKESDSSARAAELALDIGQTYKMLGLNQHSIKVYDSALEMWKKHKLGEGEEAVGGYSPQLLESLDEENLVSLVKLQTAMGQAVGSTLTKDKKESAQAFDDALMVLRYAPVSAEIKDRAFIFPIYSGMFFLLKYGVSVTYTENELIANFVDETKKHGDPVHYGRALAMQGETYHRQGRYKEAIQSHMELKQVYDVEKHHTLVVASYASDRVGQNFGCTANCYMRLNQLDKAMDIVNHIITYLMPKMDPKNVHNSIVTIYPAIWILKDHGRAEKAREIFLEYVLKPFRKYFGEDGTTPFLPAFRGLEILLDLVLYMEGKKDSFDEGYFDWALDMKNLEMKKAFDLSIGNFGRNSSSTNAEICLRLLKLTEDEELIDKLAENGMRVAEQAMSRCDGSDGSSKLLTTYLQIRPVYDELRLISPQFDFLDNNEDI